MDNRKQMLEIFKRIAGVAFALSFLMAIVLFADVGRQYISLITAKYTFFSAGAVALLFNLLSFESGKHNPVFSFVYWVGSLIVFTGLVFFIMRWPFGVYILTGGLVILGGSLLLSPNRKEMDKSSDNLLDS